MEEEEEDEDLLIDSHCHLHRGEASTSVESEEEGLRLRYVILAVDDQKDWTQLLEQYARRSDVVRIGLGKYLSSHHPAKSSSLRSS